MMSRDNVGSCCDDRLFKSATPEAAVRGPAVQRPFNERTGVGNVAFEGWAIGVACIYGVVTCLVAGIAALLVMIAPPTASISTGYSPRALAATSLQRRPGPECADFVAKVVEYFREQ
jgi:hypothetical protein